MVLIRQNRITARKPWSNATYSTLTSPNWNLGLRGETPATKGLVRTAHRTQCASIRATNRCVLYKMGGTHVTDVGVMQVLVLNLAVHVLTTRV
jgi:hypothetical protein